MNKYLVIYPSGELRWVELSSGDQQLHQMYQVIGCSMIEVVRTMIPGICIVIDECGKIKSPPQSHNELASRLYYGYKVGLGDIVGPAIVAALRPIGPYQELDLFPLDDIELRKLSLYLGVLLPDK